MSTIEFDPRPHSRRRSKTLSEVIQRYSQYAERQLERLITILGSYLKEYAWDIWVLATRTSRFFFFGWLFLGMPYLAWASVGEIMYRHTILFAGLSTVLATLFIFGLPCVLLSLAVLAYRDAAANSRSTEQQKPVGSRRRFKLSSETFVVPATPSGFRFWILTVVTSGAAITIITEIGWLFQIPVARELHDTVFAWPNVVTLDFLAYVIQISIDLLVEQVAPLT